MKQKIVLAYSGGLDTSVILKWLLEKGYEVVCYIADVGQKEDFVQAKSKALAIGASKVYVEDLKEEFVSKYIFQALKANAVYEGKYLLGTSLARPLIAQKHIEIAKPKIAELIYNGFWFSPEFEFLMAAINKSQENVEGKVYLTLYKSNAYVTGRESKKSLYDQNIASMDKSGGYDQTDASGFIKINALRLKLGAQDETMG
ncbi:argininosuccinate synthase [Candidatus Woesearchaeota archaeon]|nr:argininosuccinate synthase [Candidatus Woesearchaeota archaeon]